MYEVKLITPEEKEREVSRLYARPLFERKADIYGTCIKFFTDDEEFYRRYPVKDPKQWQYRLPKWEYEYNYQRTHQALGDITPFQAWLRYKKKVSENVT